MFALGIYLWETIVFFRYVSRCFDARVLFTQTGYFVVFSRFTFAENFVSYLYKKKKIEKKNRRSNIESLAC